MFSLKNLELEDSQVNKSLHWVWYYFSLGQKSSLHMSKGQHVDCLSSQWSGAPEL